MNWGKNLRAHQVFPGAPWEFTDDSGITPEIREDKRRRDAWINDPKTEHNVYSLFEGVNPNCRIYAGNDEDDGNPPRKQLGIIAEYDAPMSAADVEVGMRRVGSHKPAWWGRSLSGNAHILWLFEKALNLPENLHFVRQWLKFLRGKIDFHLFHIGFDVNAFDEPTRRYTNGAKWQKVSEYVIPHDIVMGWFVEFSNKYKWEESAEFQGTVPLEEVAKVLALKYPRFASWGEFILKSQGETFWVPESTSPKSAIVLDGGMYTFSAHASKSFWPWSDPVMLGPDFVKRYQAQELGRAVANIYWDEKNFWHKDGNDLWTTLNKEDTSAHLVESGLSDRRDPIRRISQVRLALNHIQRHQRIAGAAPFVYREEQIIRVNREPFLNISKCNVMTPMPGDWSFDAKTLPFLYPFLTGFFSSPLQFDFFMAWWARTYKNAYLHRPRLGQSVFICGAVGLGKTLLNRGIVAPSLGGFEDPAKFLSNSDNFGSHLFKVGAWSLDDATTIADPAKRRYYTEILKALAANRHFQFHEKYKVAARTEWLGRVIVTLNNDENSVRALPDIGRDNMDKVMFFRAADQAPVVFPSEAQIEKILEIELPILCAILLKWEIPAHVRSNETRYEIKSYHEPTLLNTAQQSSPLAAFADILDDWKVEYFKSEPRATEWVGTCLQLQKEILRDSASEMAMRAYSLDAINRMISGLKSRGYPVEIFDKDGKRLVRIKRPENLPAPKVPESSTPPPQQPNSQYNK